jgi:hypothetical protein
VVKPKLFIKIFNKFSDPRFPTRRTRELSVGNQSGHVPGGGVCDPGP